MKRREELDRLHGLSDDDLRGEAARLKESLFRSRYKVALGDIDAAKTVRRDKKTLARINTLLSERTAQK
jgi:ribosomal protein L29